VLFCDVVDSTRLASQLDPEDLRAVVRAYQEACAKVIARYEGHIAQYLGDGLLVYFGYPRAHEDDAQRAVRAGLGMIDAVGQLNTHLERERGVCLAVRLGIHTGLVVVGEVGGGTRSILATGACRWWSSTTEETSSGKDVRAATGGLTETGGAWCGVGMVISSCQSVVARGGGSSSRKARYAGHSSRRWWASRSSASLSLLCRSLFMPNVRR
jgi:Adenylate and Guanylate cyclase catalytic domain